MRGLLPGNHRQQAGSYKFNMPDAASVHTLLSLIGVKKDHRSSPPSEPCVQFSRTRLSSQPKSGSWARPRG